MKLFGWAGESALLAENPMLGVRNRTAREKAKPTPSRGRDQGALGGLDQAGRTPRSSRRSGRCFCSASDRAKSRAWRSANCTNSRDPRGARWECRRADEGTAGARCPLPSFAREVITAQLERQRDADPKAKPEFVFASKFAERTRLARHSLSQALGRVIDGLDDGGDDAETVARLKTDLRPHDLRRTLATGLARLGIPRDDRLAVLAHSYDDVHSVYDQFDRLPQKRAALETWERYLRKVIADQTAGGAEIVTLRR